MHKEMSFLALLCLVFVAVTQRDSKFLFKRDLLGLMTAADDVSANYCGESLSRFGVVSLACFGADPTYTRDSAPAFRLWWAACMAHQPGAYGGDPAGGAICLIPRGHYKASSDIIFDFASNIAGGANVQGGGANASIIHFDDGYGLTVENSDGRDIYFASFANFGVAANKTVGAACQIGNPVRIDNLNSFTFTGVWCKNMGGSSETIGMNLKNVYNSLFINVVTSAGCTDPDGYCPTGGDSLRLEQAQFNHFAAGSYSAAKIGVHLTSGANFGNTFDALDNEANYTDLLIDSVGSSYNSWRGGQWRWCGVGNKGRCEGGGGFAAVSTAGASNIIDNPNFGYPAPFGPSVSGLLLRGGPDYVSTPPFPVSGATLAHDFPRDVAITVYGGSTAWGTFCFGVAASFCMSPSATTFTVNIRAGDSIIATYSGGAPEWVWKESR